jgi:hypothetical protein
MKRSPYTVTKMFGLEAALILNRFRCAAKLSELELAEKEKQPADKDSDAAAQKEKDREEYLRYRLRQIEEWERKINGER